MVTLPIYDRSGAEVGKIDVDPAAIAPRVSKQLLHDAVVMYMSNLRQGTKKTKGRGEVSGSTKKMYRQKGTGRARQGSIRATQFRGGGTVFGATPRNYAYRINKKVRRLAVKSALSEKVQETAFSVLDKFEIAEPKTKTFVSIIEAIQAPKKTLFVVADSEDATNVYLSARNIAGATVMSASAINTYDLVNANKVVMTSAAVKQVEEALA